MRIRIFLKQEKNSGGKGEKRVKKPRQKAEKQRKYYKTT
jgi:hypothetical protein